MLRKGFVMLLLLVCVLLLPANNTYASEISVYIDGTKLESAQAPIMENGRVMVPFRAIGEALGGQVEWISESNKAVITVKYSDDSYGITANFYIDQAPNNGYYYYDRAFSESTQFYTMDVSAKVINGSTYLPLRACGEALSCNVKWDDSTQTVTITSPRSANWKAVEFTSKFSDVSYQGLMERIYRDDPSLSPYDQLTSAEQEFFDAFTPHLESFKNPTSVKLTGVGGWNNHWLFRCMAQNGFGATTTSEYLLKDGYIETKYLVADLINTNGIKYDTIKLNNALTEYYTKKGWL